MPHPLGMVVHSWLGKAATSFLLLFDDLLLAVWLIALRGRTLEVAEDMGTVSVEMGGAMRMLSSLLSFAWSLQFWTTLLWAPRRTRSPLLASPLRSRGCCRFHGWSRTV